MRLVETNTIQTDRVAMSAITIKHKGGFNKTSKFLNKLVAADRYYKLEQYARDGVAALSTATPVRSGKTASSWSYEIDRSDKGVKITWTNDNINKGVPIAIILQYGHGTGTGGYVQGQDYINPAIKPIMDRIADSVWEEVTK